jgi:predicted nucleic acid-binding protein
MVEFISSDTNVWIDFEAVDAIEMSFRLSCTYLMWVEAVENEVRSPVGLRERLLASGLVSVQLTEEEFWLADEYTERYSGISTYDAVALAIAKTREILLMTGDRRLRNAATAEDVEVIGTIGVLDRLLREGLVSRVEYTSCIGALLDANGGLVRLPENELRLHLK